MCKFSAAKTYDDIVNWIKVFFADKSKDAKAVIGISGGKDSTVCAALLVEALGQERVVGVMMPNGAQADIEDSKEVIRHLQLDPNKPNNGLYVNIGAAYEALTNAIKDSMIASDFEPSSAYKTNTPARLRMTTLYGIAHQVGGFVVNTCNLSESIVGWETYGGDGFGDFSPLGKLTVNEVIALGDYMQLPSNLVHKAPSDGMCGSTDEDKLGFTYAELDSAIRHSEVGPNFEKILNMNKKSHFKHENIHIPTYDPKLPICEAFNW